MNLDKHLRIRHVNMTNELSELIGDVYYNITGRDISRRDLNIYIREFNKESIALTKLDVREFCLRMLDRKHDRIQRLATFCMISTCVFNVFIFLFLIIRTIVIK